MENRARFGLEVAAAVVEAVGAKKVGIRISPYTTFQGEFLFPSLLCFGGDEGLTRRGYQTGMKMPQRDIEETYSYYVQQLAERHSDLAYLHAVEPRIAGNVTVEADASESLDWIVSFRGICSPSAVRSRPPLADLACS